MKRRNDKAYHVDGKDVFLAYLQWQQERGETPAHQRYSSVPLRQQRIFQGYADRMSIYSGTPTNRRGSV